MGIIGRIAVKTLAVIIVSLILPGFTVDGLWSALVASLAIAAADMFVKPVIQLFTLPLTIVTLGLFSLVVNGITLYLASLAVRGFAIDGLGTAILATIVLSLVSMVLNLLVRK